MSLPSLSSASLDLRCLIDFGTLSSPSHRVDVPFLVLLVQNALVLLLDKVLVLDLRDHLSVSLHLRFSSPSWHSKVDQQDVVWLSSHLPDFTPPVPHLLFLPMIQSAPLVKPLRSLPSLGLGRSLVEIPCAFLAWRAWVFFSIPRSFLLSRAFALDAGLFTRFGFGAGGGACASRASRPHPPVIGDDCVRPVKNYERV